MEFNNKGGVQNSFLLLFVVLNFVTSFSFMSFQAAATFTLLRSQSHTSSYRHSSSITTSPVQAHNVVQEKRFCETNRITSNTTKLRGLYPPTPMLSNGTLSVCSPNLFDQQHKLYYEIYGNKEGAPALFLHGGPGAGCFPRHARFFDPDYYRIVLLDQRGCGRSIPRGEIIDNDTWFLVDDCEALRLELNIKQWKVILGGSWGSTLALAYSQTYPTSVCSMILRGVCLMRPFEVDWLFSSRIGSASTLNKHSWNKFAELVRHKSGKSNCLDNRLSHSRDVLYDYCNWLTSGTSEHRLLASQSWYRWEMAMGGFVNDDIDVLSKHSTEHDNTTLVWDGNKWYLIGPNEVLSNVSVDTLSISNSLRKMSAEFISESSDMVLFEAVQPQCYAKEACTKMFSASNVTQDMIDSYLSYIPAQAILTSWYSVHNGFHHIPLLDHQNIDRIKDIPCIAIHGGNDYVCPVDNALDLVAMLPGIELRIPLGSSHSMYDKHIQHELVTATDKIRDRYSVLNSTTRIDNCE